MNTSKKQYFCMANAPTKWRIIIYNVYLQFLGNRNWDLEGGAVEGLRLAPHMLKRVEANRKLMNEEELKEERLE
jgi:hypothetical protein